jgi:hypothetical protein
VPRLTKATLRRLKDAIREPKIVKLNPQESKHLNYAVYARRFGWTPKQVDEIPLDIESWLLPVMAIIDEVEEEKRNAS